MAFPRCPAGDDYWHSFEGERVPMSQLRAFCCFEHALQHVFIFTSPTSLLTLWRPLISGPTPLTVNLRLPGVISIHGNIGCDSGSPRDMKQGRSWQKGIILSFRHPQMLPSWGSFGLLGGISLGFHSLMAYSSLLSQATLFLSETSRLEGCFSTSRRGSLLQDLDDLGESARAD